MGEERIVAVALLTAANLAMLRHALPRVFRVPDDTRFEALLRALDDIDDGSAERGSA